MTAAVGRWTCSRSCEAGDRTSRRLARARARRHGRHRGTRMRLKKTVAQTLATQQAIEQEARKKSRNVQPQTLEAAGYVIVVTTLTDGRCGDHGVLPSTMADRVGLQALEVAAAARPPEEDRQRGRQSVAARQVLRGQLIETLIPVGERFSPWGYFLPEGSQERHSRWREVALMRILLARAVNPTPVSSRGLRNWNPWPLACASRRAGGAGIKPMLGRHLYLSAYGGYPPGARRVDTRHGEADVRSAGGATYEPVAHEPGNALPRSIGESTDDRPGGSHLAQRPFPAGARAQGCDRDSCDRGDRLGVAGLDCGRHEPSGGATDDAAFVGLGRCQHAGDRRHVGGDDGRHDVAGGAADDPDIRCPVRAQW